MPNLPHNPADPVVLVAGELTEQQREHIAAAAPGAAITYSATDGGWHDLLPEAHVFAGPISPEDFTAARNLRWVHTWAAGPNEALYPEMIDSPVVLTCSRGNGAIPLAEHSLMLMLMLSRDVRRWLHAQQDRTWDRWIHPELAGLTCGIIGLGYAGLDLAAKARAFHMRVVGLRRSDAPATNVDVCYPRHRLKEFLGEADFVVVTAPLTPETKGMLGVDEFRAMKPTAFYVCISRGAVADDDALLCALREGWIAGAGLDAHSREPLPPDSPFWDAPNTIITPHNGASTPQTQDRKVQIFADNLRRFLSGAELAEVVDKHAGY
jgi:phosphoglycerate dehydrogenase-like enzyme